MRPGEHRQSVWERVSIHPRAVMTPTSDAVDEQVATSVGTDVTESDGQVLLFGGHAPQLLDDLVGASKERRRDREAEGAGGVEVDYQFEPRGL